jgi:hypothetical protein
MERRQPSHCIENSTTPSYFSIQFSIENHSKWHLSFCQFEPAFQGTQAGSKWHLSFCQFEWWRGDSRGIVSRTRLTSFYFSIQFSIENHLPSKERRQARSDIGAVLCQFEWFHGIRKKSHEIVSRTRQRQNYFSIHFACFFKTNKTLEVTGRELDNAVLLLDTIFYRKSLEVTVREFNNPRLTSRYILLVFTKQTKHSKWHLSFCQFEWFQGIRKKSLEIVSRTRQAKTTSRYILLVFPKQTKHSKWHLSFCQFEWFHGIRKKSLEIVSRTRQAKTTSRYILLVFPKQTKHSKWHWSNTLSVRVMGRR